jgi:hypothetical protein
MAKQSELGRKIAAIEAEIARLTGICDYLTQDAPEQAEKPKRTRKARKPGLPTEPTL